MRYSAVTFYDINPMHLPKDAIYFHNVLIIILAVSPQVWEFQEEQIWYLDQLTSPTPTAYCFYLEPELEEEDQEEETDFELCFIPHSVIEICGNEISWYEGTLDNDDDFDLKDSWKIKHDKSKKKGTD